MTQNNKEVPNTEMNIISVVDLGLNEESKIEVCPAAYSQYIRVLLQNWRQGTVGCKDRSEVSFSTRKPWKQKGTGRARAGSARSPLWRKGGVIFGPQKRVRTLKISKNTKNNVLQSLLWNYLDSRNLISLNWTPKDKPKTSEAFKLLKNLNLHEKKMVLFVNRDDYVTHASFANLSNVSMLLFDQPNAYDLSDGRYWAFLDKDLDSFKGMVNSWL